ncbi:uncharacterized protein LOC135486411 isoform X1 [Lineus longissimus]|uniref:uncharacterized protein LOC135486411 isoform X1 n=1 Tax=Lineus longissimus TaxID=88925 RepID=UPI002B4F435D
MAAEVETKKAKWGDGFVYRRTQAMPKNTLFGSMLEKRDEVELKKLGEMDLDAYDLESKPRQRVRDPPPALSFKIKDDSKIKQAQRELEQRLKRTKDAEQRLAMMEAHARYYPKDISTDQRNPKPGQFIDARPHQWITEMDLGHTSDINIFGVNRNTKSFNRDKYEELPPVHKYALIGDVLRPGMDFTAKKPQTSPMEERKQIDADMYDSHYSKMYGHRKQHSSNALDLGLAVQLPVNIQHQFGTKVCQNLLSDNDKVQNTLKEQQKRKESFLRSRQQRPPIRDVKPSGSPGYVALGNATRHNVFPGYTFGNQRSLMKSAYTRDVHDRHDPDPDQYRCRRDELSTWAESNVLRERMKKAWDQYLAEILPK